jgi:hypothetical protein
MKIAHLLESINRNGNSKTAVVGWGRGMGHKGHMYLASAVLTQASESRADPYFFVSETMGEDDPLTPQEKLYIYKKVFHDKQSVFHTAKTINQVAQTIYDLGYENMILVVGADQKAAFQFLARPTKATGQLPVPFNTVKVISRQETNDEYANEEGPRATPMREVLINGSSDKKAFSLWRDAMPSALTDKEVLKFMKLAKKRLGVTVKETDMPQSNNSPIPGTPMSMQVNYDAEEEQQRKKTTEKLFQWMNHPV